MWLLCGLYQQVCTIFSPRSLKLCALSLHARTWYCMLLVCDCSSHTVNFISMVPIRGHIGWDQQTHVHGVPPPEGPANPGSMVCQRDQREGGTSKPSRGSPQARRPESGDGRVECWQSEAQWEGWRGAGCIATTSRGLPQQFLVN